MFNVNDNIPARYCHTECTWGTDHRGDGTHVNIPADTVFEECSNPISLSPLAPISQGPPDWREQDSSAWKEHLQRDEYHETNYEFHSCDGSSAWSHNVRENRETSGSPLDFLGQNNSLDDVTMSWSSTAPQPSRGRHSPSTFPSSNNQTLDHNLLSPYPCVNEHRRSQSDASSESFMRSGRLLSLAEPAPSISWDPWYEESAYSDRSGSGSPSWSGVSSEWASPNRSPNPSPQSISSHLPDIDGRTEIPIVVLKQDVTSERMRKASELRRQQKAKYECPVTGCGSTFTRRINLEGHIRAHSDERPFVCTWTGCGKGFARLHDHKRHEQLHAIGHPFACEGCKKKFARLDALNRHRECVIALCSSLKLRCRDCIVRSKGGEECRQMIWRYGRTGDTEMVKPEPPPTSAGTVVWSDSRETFPSVAL